MRGGEKKDQKSNFLCWFVESWNNFIQWEWITCLGEKHLLIFVSWVACIDTQTNWLVLKRWCSGWGGISFVQFHHWSVLKRTSTRFLTWYWSLKEDERRNHTIPLMGSIFIRLFWTSLSLSFSIELSPLVLAFFFFFFKRNRPKHDKVHYCLCFWWWKSGEQVNKKVKEGWKTAEEIEPTKTTGSHPSHIHSHDAMDRDSTASDWVRNFAIWLKY